MAGLIVSYEEAVPLGAVVVGGKGWNLGRLHRYGFAVPRGGILIAETYAQFMQEPTLRALCAQVAGVQFGAVDDAEIADLLRQLRDAIEATAFCAEVQEAVHTFLDAAGLADVPVAVRSSATAEDGAVSSFAGMHNSFLNVTGDEEVLRAIKGCYASLWTPRALAYRRKPGLADEAVACAVVICAMVSGPGHSPPVAAGVAFSCDPRTGQRNRVCINAAPGWGDAVVSGRVSPEETAVVQGPDGEAPRIERSGGAPQVLADAQLVALAALVRRVLWALGDGQEPQDVEWAYDGERFWLVQARPVTHLPRVTLPAAAKLPTIWSNANLKDVMPGVLTPLSWSILQPLVSAILYAPCQAVGAVLPEGTEVMRRFSGRAYFDLTTMLWSYCDTLGLLPHEVTRGMGGHQPEIPVPSRHPLRGRAGPRRIRARLRLLSVIARTGRTLRRDMPRLRAQARAQTDRPLTDLPLLELLALLQRVQREAQTFGYRFQLANLGGVWTSPKA